MDDKLLIEDIDPSEPTIKLAVKLNPESVTLEKMEILWNQAKAEENNI